ncbi:hypothetical protein DAPPUDRAFT_245602 [Daphnia pulex]|uniref:Uncharacterized protein n=1 Tax=Daphnia pulex TaxID=6669 RepID=E9GNN1_DAPPU|nr:hypothetical protein DAPPUDRAFT_245602 [Daphnia pulex]|eukprot:EFX78934.1 hypothetical protein DAPPUDRAFT_245602 [Daphnia pulex]
MAILHSFEEMEYPFYSPSILADQDGETSLLLDKNFDLLGTNVLYPSFTQFLHGLSIQAPLSKHSFVIEAMAIRTRGQHSGTLKARTNANSATHAFVTSSEITAALSLAGTFNFDQRIRKLKDAKGEEFLLCDPFVNESDEWPVRGCNPVQETY